MPLHGGKHAAKALREADVEVVFSDEMTSQSVQLDFSSWRDELREIEVAAEQKVEANLNSDEVPIDPQRMCRELRVCSPPPQNRS